ncbi:U1 small nuclear ribonucleoprotein C-like [Oscarella lobularis]|uniref:U1 small nuclear ribonucleoprotein C-like n=1 Tax=Oscarella lobularis TaxID=121494 RepID=UPI0033138494
MPKYYCDYCDTYLTHDSPSVRKTHNSGRKHKDNVRIYYTRWMEDQAQALINQTTAALTAGGMLPPPPLPGMPAPPMLPGMPLPPLPMRPGMGMPPPHMHFPPPHFPGQPPMH